MLYGFGLLLIFFLLLNLDRRFRDYARRSLMRPFNFFADLRDRRMLPNSQTAMLAIVLSGAIALAKGALLHDAYSVSKTDHWLGVLLPVNLRTWAMAQDGSYFAMVMWLTLISLAVMLAIVFVMRFVAMFRRGRILIGDTFNVTIWSFLPFVILLPLDLILPRMDITMQTVQLTAMILFVLWIWTYYRLLKGAGVLFDVYPARLYIYGTFALAVLGILVAGYLKVKI